MFTLDLTSGSRSGGSCFLAKEGRVRPDQIRIDPAFLGGQLLDDPPYIGCGEARALTCQPAAVLLRDEAGQIADGFTSPR